MSALRNLSAGLTVVASLLVLGGTVAEAREKLTYAQGMRACMAWCDSHNSSASKRSLCHSQCDFYWVHNGSDGDQLLIDGQ